MQRYVYVYIRLLPLSSSLSSLTSISSSSFYHYPHPHLYHHHYQHHHHPTITINFSLSFLFHLRFPIFPSSAMFPSLFHLSHSLPHNSSQYLSPYLFLSFPTLYANQTVAKFEVRKWKFCSNLSLLTLVLLLTWINTRKPTCACTRAHSREYLLMRSSINSNSIAAAIVVVVVQQQ